MIDSAPDGTGGSDWLPPLRDLIRRSAHETRNALNGLVVNLEVVRSRLERSGGQPSVLSFAEQARAQSEESVRLNESVAALLSLIVGSIDAGGKLRCALTAPASSAMRFEVEPGTAERVLPGLQTLGKTIGFSVERHDSAVILSFPRTSSEFKEHQ